MTMSEPVVSVIMPCYNAEKYLPETMESIISQSFGDWELVAVDDGSVDGTRKILEKYGQADKRIRIIINEKNMGLQNSLNRAVRESRGKYIARMDSDDICLRDRLKKQVAYLEKHKNTSLCSCKYFDLKEGKIIDEGPASRPGDPESVAALLLCFNPILHPGVMGRRKCFEGHPYRPEFTCSEDLALWTELIIRGEKIAVLPDYLMLYRRHPGQITAKSFEKQREQVKKIFRVYYEGVLMEISPGELDFLLDNIYFRNGGGADGKYPATLDFLKKIEAENKKRGFFTKKAVRNLQKEVLMTQKYAGRISKGELFKELLELGPGFASKQIIIHIINKRIDGARRRKTLKKLL